MTQERRNGAGGRREDDDATVRLARIEEQIKGMRSDIDKNFEVIGRRLDSKVSRVEFLPVRNLVYGLVGVIMVAVFGALIALAITTSTNGPIPLP